MDVRVLYLLCCVGSDLCDELMTRLEESYRAFVCVCLYIYIYIYIYLHTTNTLDMLDKRQFFSLSGIRLVLPCESWVNITSNMESVEVFILLWPQE